MRYFITIAVFAAITAFISRAQDVTVKARFDTTRIYIGDQVKFCITAEKPADAELIIPFFYDTLVAGIEILKGPSIDSSVLGNGYVRIKHEYLITSFDSGFYQIPPVYGEIKSGTGIRRYYSDYSWLQVMRVNIAPPDSASGIFDIIDPGRVPLTAGEIIPWILLAAGVLIIAWILTKLVKRFGKGKDSAVKQEITEPAHVIAFRKLEKLRDEKLWQKGEVKLYYSRLTEIIREYLMNRYSIPALELTTVETLEALLRNGIAEDEVFRKLRTILTGGDLVKFAKYQPEPSENEIHFDYAWEYVKATMKLPEPEPAVTDSGNERRES